MALIKLDPKSLELSVEVGILEEYKTDGEIQTLHDSTNQLRDQTMQVAFDITQTVTMQEAVIKFKENKDLEDKWMEHMQSEYAPALTLIVEKIKLKNEQICPGYSEYLKSLQA